MRNSSTIKQLLLSNTFNLVDIVVSQDPTIRNLSLNDVIVEHQRQQQQNNTIDNSNSNTNQWLLGQCSLLDHFRREDNHEKQPLMNGTNDNVNSSTTTTNKNKNTNLYEKVRACFFLYSIHRFYLSNCEDIRNNRIDNGSKIPYIGYKYLQDRKYNEAIDIFLQQMNHTAATTNNNGSNGGAMIVSPILSSALAQAYYELSFQLLKNQVRSSVRQHPGNLWMYETDAISKYPKQYYILPDMLSSLQCQNTATATNHNNGNASATTISSPFPYLKESTPVRMDLTHCGWSDIFFLGMDYPEGAKVINCSINLSVRPPITVDTSSNDRDSNSNPIPKPPIDTYVQVFDTTNGGGALKLTSIDLKAECTLTHISEVFDFGKDYLGLIKAGIIASGIVPIGLEHSQDLLSTLFNTTIGMNRGLHITTHVHDIPKGSRLAVSTNLLASVIAACMRISGQTTTFQGPFLEEQERRLVAARAILGEWLGGSGGGWQDSGGIWPGMKLIQGVCADSPSLHPEYGISRGQLLPCHRPFSQEEVSLPALQSLQDHLVLVHGGMAQNVGPILNMVTEKYLLRESAEWDARKECLSILDDILMALQRNDIPTLAQLTTCNFFGPYQTIIPWCSNLYTETLIERISEKFPKDFLGFWMLGGASGGGMGFLFTKEMKPIAVHALYDVMLQTKREMEYSIPFAMDPVIYDFSINQYGTTAAVVHPGAATNKNNTVELIPVIQKTKVPQQQQQETNENNSNNTQLPSSTTRCCDNNDDDVSFNDRTKSSFDEFLQKLHFDSTEHESIRQLYRDGIIGLSQNRLQPGTIIEDVVPSDVIFTNDVIDTSNNKNNEMYQERGLRELREGTVAVVTLAAGVGSRWTNGAGCVKALNPFCRLNGKHRSFLEVHIAKSRKISNLVPDGSYNIPHVITTSIMTDDAIRSYLQRVDNHGYAGPLYISLGQTMGLRLIPTIADLEYTFHHNEHKLDEQAQKVRESCQKALIDWARSCGEASDYRDNIPMQCLHPVGHFYEIPNLLLNGTLRSMLSDRPQLKYLLLHNVDTVGANVDPGLLGLFASQEDPTTLCFEVIPRRIQDVGGGLATVNGQVRMVEGLALPNEEDEFNFSYYNSMTTWINIDRLLEKFGLNRSNVMDDPDKVSAAVLAFARRLPTYVAVKEVKKRWGNAQEDVVLTAQFEKLWSDLSGLDDFINETKYFVVPRFRGSQLKDVAQLDGWLRDSSASYVESLCSW